MLVIVGFGVEAGDFGCITLIDMFFFWFNLKQPHCASGWFFIV